MSDTTATILVVDDLPANRDLMVRRLERSGFNVIAAASGPEALEVVGRGNIDLVLLDIMMPGMTGIDVLRTIRMSRSSAALPVVMVTAKTDSEDVVEALSLGANDYVTKPVDYPVALARIQGHLRTTKALRVEAAPAAIEPRSPAQAVPGTVLGGRYRLDQPIGGGSFGTVFRARHLELNRDVAVKILATSAGTDPEALKRFRREGDSACRVQHPNAVAVFDFAVNAGGVAYLVMELLEGHSLEKELEERGPLPARRSALIVIPVCSALAAAHAAGVVHRDIKPSNVFLHRSGQREIAKILDFGIAKLAADSALGQSLTVDGSLLGTPGLHGAGALPPRHLRPELRHLQRRRDALRDALGPAAVHSEHRRPARARGDAGRGGPAADPRPPPRGSGGARAGRAPGPVAPARRPPDGRAARAPAGAGHGGSAQAARRFSLAAEPHRTPSRGSTRRPWGAAARMFPSWPLFTLRGITPALG